MSLDFKLCIICQNDTPEALRYPNNESLYVGFLDNLNRFREIGACPVDLKLGSEITAQQLLENHWGLHRSCQINTKY